MLGKWLQHIHDVHHDHESINGLPQGMKSYPIQFSMLPYYEHLQIAHLFDMMHIGKNVTETLWKLLEIRMEKDKVVKYCKDIQERNHAMKDFIQFHSNRDQVNINSIPWMFMEQQRNVVKELMRKIKFPTGFCASLKNIITKKVILRGSKHMIGMSSPR